MKKLRIDLIIIGLLIIAGFFCFLNFVGLGLGDIIVTDDEPDTIQRAMTTITASELKKDYEANEIAADAKYRSRVIELSGVVEKIGRDFLNNHYITLSAGDYKTVQCVFVKNSGGVLAGLSKGDQVVVIGECRGSSIGSVVLKECRIK